ncbi:MAG: glycosyltransferase [Endomicrobia bacterium]|nr:glycosyltransferase [Endomicrobiia bacterium]
MKILHIITRLDKGGSAENVLHSCEYFAYKKTPVKKDYDVVLVYGLSNSKLYKSEKKYKIYYIKELKRNISFFDFIAFVKIYFIIKKEKPEIVHTHTSKAGILGRWATFLVNLELKFSNKKLIKVVHTPHGHIFYGYYNKTITMFFILLEKITSFITDKFIALTEGERDESLSFNIGSYTKWAVIHSGVNFLREVCVDLAKLKISLGLENKLIVGTVARLEPVKGIKYFIYSIPIILSNLSLEFKEKIIFLIVGDGSERQQLENLAELLKIRNKVVFAGMAENVFELMSLIDIYVQPSLNEGMGKTLVMAQYLGKPVVATKVQGIPSIVLDKKTGILVEPRSPAKLAEAILFLINNNFYRENLAKNAKEWMNTIEDKFLKFSVENMICKLELLYEEISNI